MITNYTNETAEREARREPNSSNKYLHVLPGRGVDFVPRAAPQLTYVSGSVASLGRRRGVHMPLTSSMSHESGGGSADSGERARARGGAGHDDVQRSKDERNNDYEHQSTFTSPPFRGARPGDSPTAHHLGKSAYRFADTSRSPRRSLDGRRSVDGSDLTTTSGGVRVPKRPRSYASDDDVQPTRAFGASPGTKRALSELMANNLLRLNVSPMDTASPSGGSAGDSTPPSSLASAFVNPFGMAEDTTEGARGTEAWGTNGADATDEEGRVGAESPSARTSPNPPVKVTGFTPSPMSEDEPASGSVQDVAAVALQASMGGETLFDRRRRSYLSQQLSGAPQATGLTALTATRALRVPPSSRLFGTLSSMEAASVAMPSSPSAEPSPRSDLRKQAILGSAKRASLLQGGLPLTGFAGLSRAFGTSPPPQPRRLLPAAIAEVEEMSDDDDDLDM